MFKKSKLSLENILSAFSKTIEDLESFQKEQEDLESNITLEISKLNLQKESISEDIIKANSIKNNIKNLLNN